MCLEKVRQPVNIPCDGVTHSYTQGVATRDDIDKTLKLGMNHPMGPLQLGPFRSLPSRKSQLTVANHERFPADL